MSTILTVCRTAWSQVKCYDRSIEKFSDLPRSGAWPVVVIIRIGFQAKTNYHEPDTPFALLCYGWRNSVLTMTRLERYSL